MSFTSNNRFSVISGSNVQKSKAIKAIRSKTSKEQRPKSQIKHDVDDPLYKTELCSYYIEGKCKNGFRCKYAHGTQQLRPKPMRKPASQHENPCPEKKGTQMCRYGKNCTRGDSCWFAHDSSELVRPKLIPENYKTQMCRHMAEKGHCNCGDNCTFAHSKEELGYYRARGEKRAPPLTAARQAGWVHLQMPAAEVQEEVAQTEYAMDPEDFPSLGGDDSDNDDTQSCVDQDDDTCFWDKPVDMTDMVPC